MIGNRDITKICFLDIECVSGKASYDELSEEFQYLWKLKSRSVLRRYDEPITDEEAAEAYKEKAGIYAEFGKIVCISVGVVGRNPDTKEFFIRLKSFASEDEAELLRDFSEMVTQFYNNTATHSFCGHNIREFDMPYICRRLLINQLPLPHPLNIAGKKPWETKHFIDTLELWKFGDYKNYTSLKLLAAVFGFPSPKDDIDGSEVGFVFWEGNDLPRIAKYCEKDVLATAQLLFKYMRMPVFEEHQIKFIS